MIPVKLKKFCTLGGFGLFMFSKVFGLFALSFTEYTMGIYSAHFVLQAPQVKEPHTAGAVSRRALSDLWHQRKQTKQTQTKQVQNKQEQSLVFQMVYQKNYAG